MKLYVHHNNIKIALFSPRGALLYGSEGVKLAYYINNKNLANVDLHCFQKRVFHFFKKNMGTVG